MDRQDLIKIAWDFTENSEANFVSAAIAISEKAVGLKMYQGPILGFGAADDEYFKLLKQTSVVGEHFLLPTEWLPRARTVISFFLPFTAAVRNSNRLGKVWPSEEWLHARIEGQAFVAKLCRRLQSELTRAGHDSIVPTLDPRFWNNTDRPEYERHFSSNWSERHVAHVCGLGTFGLSKGLITPRGMAGRFGSVITTLYLPPNQRGYQAYDEYCSLCGKCADNCPVKAISLEGGKDHLKCSRFLDRTTEKFKPRYGCGKCQVGVPCEFEIPPQVARKGD